MSSITARVATPSTRSMVPVSTSTPTMTMDVLGGESKDQVRPRTDCRSLRGAASGYKSNGQQPRSLVAAQYPRCGGGRKGAYRRRDAMASAAHPCPRHHDEHRARARSRSDLPDSGPEVRALYVPYKADTHGLSRLLTVSRNRCSTALSCLWHVVRVHNTNGVSGIGR